MHHIVYSNLENENYNFKKETDKLTENNKDLNRLYDALEVKNSTIKSQLENLIKENSTISSNYQNKIEILQAKMFEKLAPDDNSTSDKMNSLIMENINEMKGMFKSKTDNLHNLLVEIKDDSEKADLKFERLINDRSNYCTDTIHKVKGEIENSLIGLKAKLDSSLKGDVRQEWLKKQVSELMSYKLKSSTLESQVAKLEQQIHILSHKVNDSKLLNETTNKIIIDTDLQMKQQREYVGNLEAKLSDVKDFVFKNCPDKLDELEGLL